MWVLIPIFYGFLTGIIGYIAFVPCNGEPNCPHCGPSGNCYH